MEAILKAWGFVEARSTKHKQWVHEDLFGKKRVVSISHPHGVVFGVGLIKDIRSQSGLSREQFYCGTKTTARKINMTKMDVARERARGIK